MYNKQIFPSSITEFSVESLQKSILPKAMSFIGFGVSIFWAEVDVNVHRRAF